MQPHLDVGLGELERLRDLGRAQALDEAQHDHHAERLGERVDRALEQGHELLARQRCVRGLGLEGPGETGERVGGCLDHLALALLAPRELARSGEGIPCGAGRWRARELARLHESRLSPVSRPGAKCS